MTPRSQALLMSRAFLGLWAVGISAQASARQTIVDLPGEEAQRVALVERLRRSCVAIYVEGREVAHTAKKVALEREESLGTGVVLSADGLILTAAHVVRGAETIRVRAESDEPAEARVVFSDVEADVALLRVAKVPMPLHPAKLGDSDRVRLGQTVYVIGNPEGIEHSLSLGVVSGRHATGHWVGGTVEEELIQTDASINPGSSGGPFFDSRGEVIAISQSIVTEGGGSEGLGFGIAINVVKKILGIDPCIWLGFSGIPLNSRWTAALNAPDGGGILVEGVTPGGPAEAAGLIGGEIPVAAGEERLLIGGDVILSVDGIPFTRWAAKPPTISREPGQKHSLTLTVLRSGRVMELPMVLVHRERW